MLLVQGNRFMVVYFDVVDDDDDDALYLRIVRRAADGVVLCCLCTWTVLILSVNRLWKATAIIDGVERRDITNPLFCGDVD